MNVAVFGMTAKQFQKQFPNKEGNLRDNASIEELLVINNTQLLNSEMIKSGIDSPTRLKELNRIAKEQYQTLVNNNQKALQELKKLDNKSKSPAINFGRRDFRIIGEVIRSFTSKS